MNVALRRDPPSRSGDGGIPAASAHAPELLGFVDHGDWVAVVLEDVEGRHPHLPVGTPPEIAAVLDALADLARDPSVTTSPVRTLEDETSDLFAGWRRLLDDPTNPLSARIRTRPNG